MSKWVQDLGVGRPYTLEVSVSAAGVELTAVGGDFPSAATLKTEAEVLDLIRALGGACKRMREKTGGPSFFERTDAEPHAVNRAVHDAETAHIAEKATVYCVDHTSDKFIVRTCSGRAMELSLVEVEKAIDDLHKRQAAAVGAEDEDLLRERAVTALIRIGLLTAAGSNAQMVRIVSEALPELVEYLGSQFVERRHEGDPAKRRGPLFDGWAPRPAAEPVANFPVQADAAARMEGDFVKEMHALAAKYRGTVIQDSVILEVAKIEETVAERIATWLEGAINAKGLAQDVRAGAWKKGSWK
jgi:hypothetical protein